MTTVTTITADITLIAPSLEDELDFQFEHSIVVARFGDSVSLTQNGESITIPRYAVREVMAALRSAESEWKQETAQRERS